MRKSLRFSSGVVLVPLLLLFFNLRDTNCQQYYRLGDASHDGWCNMADVVTLVNWSRGYTSPNFCPEGADANGSGNVAPNDVTYLLDFFQGGSPPIGLCLDVTVACDINEQAGIWLIPVADSNPDQANFSVYIEASNDVYAINFAYKFDPGEIADISAGNLRPDVYLIVRERAFIGGDSIVTFLIDPNTPAYGGSFPMGIGGTRIFDITVERQQGAPNSLLRIVEDPIHGPPYFYFGPPGSYMGDNIICPLSPDILPCDANNSGGCNGLDVTYLVNYFKGVGPAPTGKYFYNVPVWWNY